MMKRKVQILCTLEYSIEFENLTLWFIYQFIVDLRGMKCMIFNHHRGCLPPISTRILTSDNEEFISIRILSIESIFRLQRF